jgi:Putative esterase
MVRLGLGLLFSMAVLGAQGKGALLEEFDSALLKRKVPISLHVPDEAVIANWRQTHPEQKMRLVLFLPGAYDHPKDLMTWGIYEDLAKREASGELAPALWIAATHFRSWYADRKDGSFPYERFLMEELLPQIEKRFHHYGTYPDRRTVAGFSMGGFGALNLAGRTKAFGRCLALSPALIEPPFAQVPFYVRWSLKKIFPDDKEAFAPFDPWKHLGGDSELIVGCGLQDKYKLEGVTRQFAGLCEKRGRPVFMTLRDGNHDWKYWSAEFKRLAPWVNGGAAPAN